MKKTIIFNWKANIVKTEKALELIDIFEKNKDDRFNYIFCVPSCYYYLFKENLGAQNIFWLNRGSYTGEITSEMLKEFNVDLVLLGHLERKVYFCEDNCMINNKVKHALKNNFETVLCIGEHTKRTDEDNTSFRIKKILFKQLSECLSGIKPEEVKKLSIAYEPVDNIGKSDALNSDQLLKIQENIRTWLEVRFGKEISQKIKFYYGGSISSKNVNDYLKFVDGVLVGTSSVNPTKFKSLLKNLINY